MRSLLAIALGVTLPITGCGGKSKDDSSLDSTTPPVTNVQSADETELREMLREADMRDAAVLRDAIEAGELRQPLRLRPGADGGRATRAKALPLTRF